jgi:hypothetical protein
MSQYPNRFLAPTLIAALFLIPALAAARPVQKDGVHAASKRPIAGESAGESAGTWRAW